MSDDAKAKFETAMFNQIVESHRRLGVFLSHGQTNYIGFLVSMEALLLIEKIRLLDPEHYGQAVASFNRDDDKVARGWCCGTNCYERLVTPRERCEFPPAVQMFLDKWCPACAEAVVKDMNTPEEPLSDADKELLKDMEEDLADSDNKSR